MTFIQNNLSSTAGNFEISNEFFFSNNATFWNPLSQQNITLNKRLIGFSAVLTFLQTKLWQQFTYLDNWSVTDQFLTIQGTFLSENSGFDLSTGIWTVPESGVYCVNIKVTTNLTTGQVILIREDTGIGVYRFVPVDNNFFILSLSAYFEQGTPWVVLTTATRFIETFEWLNYWTVFKV